MKNMLTEFFASYEAPHLRSTAFPIKVVCSSSRCPASPFVGLLCNCNASQLHKEAVREDALVGLWIRHFFLFAFVCIDPLPMGKHDFLIFLRLRFLSKTPRVAYH